MKKKKKNKKIKKKLIYFKLDYLHDIYFDIFIKKKEFFFSSIKRFK
jgi:hypothetical protein